MAYNFLILSLFFLLPGTLIFMIRSDLRGAIVVMALCSIPFAFTESLFYPSYWEPKFLFDLADRIGFGLEDFLFVIGLGAFTSTAYAFFLGAHYEALGDVQPGTIVKRYVAVMSTAFALILIVRFLDIEMIYGSFGIMLGVGGFIGLRRKDLIVPGLLGGLLSMFVYSLLSLGFAWIIPGVYNLAWHTEKFLNVFILGIPLEELIYGFASGVAATVFYPYAFYQRFNRKRELKI